jgi:hypothetical protein
VQDGAMRIAILLTLVGLAACSRESGETADASANDVSTIAAQRAKANIENYAAANAHTPAHPRPPTKR